MAKIELTAISRSSGPSIPTQHGASLKDIKWEGGGTVKELVLYIADSSIHIWPADPDCIEYLGKRLIELSNILRKE